MKYDGYFLIGKQRVESEFSFRRLKFKGDISKSTRVTPDFIRLKGKITPAAIETVVSYLDQDTEKLRDVSITGLADAVRWVDRLLGILYHTNERS